MCACPIKLGNFEPHEGGLYVVVLVRNCMGINGVYGSHGLSYFEVERYERTDNAFSAVI